MLSILAGHLHIWLLHPKENLAFYVEERDWAKGVPSNGIILPGYPDPISQAPILSDVSFPPNYLQKTDELFQDSWLTLAQLERDTIQPQGTAGMDFANKLLGLIQLGPTWPKRDF